MESNTAQPAIENIPQSISPPSVPVGYKILGVIDIIVGIFELVMGGFFLLFVLPRLSTLYKDLDIKTSLATTYIELLVIIILAVINIFLGIKLIRSSISNKKILILGIVTPTVSFVLTSSLLALVLITTMPPIYKATENTNPVNPTTTDMAANWKIYTNSTYAYSIKFPDSYQVPPQSEKEKSQLGIDKNICVRRKSDTACIIPIDVYKNSDNLPLEDYINKIWKSLINGPLINNNFNGYSSLFVKGHPGADNWISRNSLVYHISAPTASSDKEVADILATFKFTDLNQLNSLSGLPVYPNATFVEKNVGKTGDDPKCEPGNVSPACMYGTTVYSYTTKDSWQKVHEWYNNSSGWKLSGGAGAEGSSTSTFTKNTDKIQVSIIEYPAEGVTKITIEIPNKP